MALVTMVGPKQALSKTGGREIKTNINIAASQEYANQEENCVDLCNPLYSLKPKNKKKSLKDDFEVENSEEMVENPDKEQIGTKERKEIQVEKAQDMKHLKVEIFFLI